MFKNGCIQIDGRTSHYKQGKHIHSTYSLGEIDYFVTFYDMNCYAIPASECNTGKTLRIENPKNNQSKNLSYAQDYLVEKIFFNHINNMD